MGDAVAPRGLEVDADAAVSERLDGVVREGRVQEADIAHGDACYDKSLGFSPVIAHEMIALGKAEPTRRERHGGGERCIHTDSPIGVG